MIRIIIIEDHPVVTTGLQDLLKDEKDMSLLATARNGAQGKILVELHKPDVAILDVGLGDISGVDVTRWIRSKGLPTKVLAYSASQDPKDIMGMMQAGTNGYLLKTDDIRAVTAGIRDIYHGRTAFSHEVVQIWFEANRQGLAPAPNQQPQFSRREVEVLHAISQGMDNKTIGERLHISVSTVETHLTRLMDKTGCPNGRALVRWAIEHGYSDLELS